MIAPPIADETVTFLSSLRGRCAIRDLGLQAYPYHLVAARLWATAELVPITKERRGMKRRFLTYVDSLLCEKRIKVPHDDNDFVDLQ